MVIACLDRVRTEMLSNASQQWDNFLGLATVTSRNVQLYTKKQGVPSARSKLYHVTTAQTSNVNVTL
jgi:hypothetical protein